MLCGAECHRFGAALVRVPYGLRIIFWGVCSYFCVVGCVWLCVCWLPEEPVIYVGSSWYEGVCVFGIEMCEARGVVEAGEWGVV